MRLTKNVYQLIAAVSAEIAKEGIGKDRKNQAQGYNFRGIDDIYNALAPVISRHGLVILPRIMSRVLSERTTAKGGSMSYVTVEAEFDFVSSHDGTKHTVKTFGEAMDSADKATIKAMSAAYKYAAFQTFCIPTEGDNDSESTNHQSEPDGLAEFESVHLKSMRDASMQGQQALTDAFGRLPKGPVMAAFWQKHQAALKAAAKAVL